MRISLLAEVAEGGAMDRASEIPWHFREGRKRSHDLTLGQAVVMSEALFKAIGVITNRLNIVVCRRDRDFSDQGVLTASSLGDALMQAVGRGVRDLFCIGGADLHWQAMSVADRIYLTRVDRKFKGKTFFPAIDPEVWRCVYAAGTGPHYHAGEKFFAQFLEFDKSKVMALS